MRGPRGSQGEARLKGPARDAAAGLAEVMAMPAIWKDAAGNLIRDAATGKSGCCPRSAG